MPNILAPTEYLNRLDRAAQYIHWIICKNLKLPHDKKWWEYKIPPMLENNRISFFWSFTAQTNSKIDANRPDIILKDVRRKSRLLIDKTVPIDINLFVMTYKILSGYKDLKVGKMWNLGTKTIFEVTRCPRNDSKMS